MEIIIIFACIGIFSLLIVVWASIDLNKKNTIPSPTMFLSMSTSIPTVTAASTTTNCETLVSKDGTIRIEIYTIHTNNVEKVATNEAVRLEK